MHIISKTQIFALLGLLTACTTTTQAPKWGTDVDITQTNTPSNLMYGEPPVDTTESPMHHMAVLLPTSGENADAGRAIRNSIETAVLERGGDKIAVTFYDTGTNATAAIDNALTAAPEIIIGPLFSNNARFLRDAKPAELPVLSFTSDASALGNGVMTMALMPNNSTETIVNQMSADGVKDFIILAPDTQTGHTMAGAAVASARIYNINLIGVFFYSENDTDSIKNTTYNASMNAARTAANTRAREILSDILTNEQLTTVERSSITRQLEKLAKSETLGHIPYDAILFLGGADDTKSLVSFLRYYGVAARDTRFYGTAMWDGTNIASDLTMTGARFTALPETSTQHSIVYEQVTGATPSQLASFGYDAANLAMNMLWSDKSNSAYLLDPSGYIGLNGLFRLTPYGASERPLRIMETNGNGSTTEIATAPKNFLTPVYQINPHQVRSAEAMALQTRGINPNDYITIPARLADKYRSKTYGTNITVSPHKKTPLTEVITILPADTSPITASDFQPIQLESIQRTYLDSVEITE